jgi:glycosyltransferase involved in cell wall biosynthesis
MILMVHGYGLNGSGSNLWTRSVVAALCEQGVTVHLCCQERRPEAFDFIREVIDYDEDGRPQASLTSNHAERGGCILHRPSLDVLPTYVRPSAGATGMKCILDMSEDQIEDYLGRNDRALASVLSNYPIQAVHVNHVVLMSEAVRRACRSLNRPFAVMPHGSAIEYVVKKSEPMRALATDILTEADRILVLNDEMRSRITSTFPDIADVESKMLHVPVGVDVRKFRVVHRDDRSATIEQLFERLSAIDRGRDSDQAQRLRDVIRDDATLDDVERVFKVSGDYPQRRPDVGVEDVLRQIDWKAAPVVGYVGRVLGHKGVHAILAAFPLILDEHPEASLVIAGSGPLREWIEAFRYALAGGHRDLVHHLVEWGGRLEGEEKPFDHIATFFEGLAADGREDRYFESARRLSEPGRFATTGYMDHSELSLLFGCLDVGVFPSIVREASPLVVPEAMASGVFPMGTYFGGMAASLDHASRAIPSELQEFMRVRAEPEHMVADIARNVSAILERRPELTEELHGFAVQHYDWQQIANRMVANLESLSRSPAS